MTASLPPDRLRAMARAIMQAECGGPLGYFANGSPMREAAWEDYDEAQHAQWEAMARACWEASPGGDAARSVLLGATTEEIPAGYEAVLDGDGNDTGYRRDLATGEVVTLGNPDGDDDD